MILVKFRTFHGSGARNPLNIATIMYVFHTWLPGFAFLVKILVLRLKSWNFTKNCIFSWKLLISTKFQEIYPQGYFFEGHVKYRPEPYIIAGVSCPFSKRPPTPGRTFTEKSTFRANHKFLVKFDDCGDFWEFWGRSESK